jgi:hypothetical protein
MAYMLVQHRVADFERWKDVFDDKLDLRQASGELSSQIFHDAADQFL